MIAKPASRIRAGGVAWWSAATPQGVRARRRSQRGPGASRPGHPPRRRHPGEERQPRPLNRPAANRVSRRSSATSARRRARAAEARSRFRARGWRGSASTGIGSPDGGSAMPCGLVLPAARAKLVDGDCEPEVRPARVVVLVDAVGAAIDDPQVADVGRVERDARRAGAGRGDGPAPDERPGQRVLEDLVGGRRR